MQSNSLIYFLNLFRQIAGSNQNQANHDALLLARMNIAHQIAARGSRKI